jgi:hypothetical protein
MLAIGRLVDCLCTIATALAAIGVIVIVGPTAAVVFFFVTSSINL